MRLHLVHIIGDRLDALNNCLAHTDQNDTLVLIIACAQSDLTRVIQTNHGSLARSYFLAADETTKKVLLDTSGKVQKIDVNDLVKLSVSADKVISWYR